MQVLKQRFSCTRIETEVWELRYYDFYVYSERKRQKLRYIHDNPINAGLVPTYADGPWSSYNAYAGLNPGPVKVTLLPSL